MKWGRKTERWFEDKYDECDENFDCWVRIYEEILEWNAQFGLEVLAETIAAWREAVLPEILDLFREIWIDERGYDLNAWRELLEAMPEDWREDAALEIGRWLRQEIMELVETTLEENPEARRMWRKYMGELIDDVVEGWLMGLTQREIATRTGYALHDVWNTTWWLRKYAGVDLWPPRR